MVVWAYAATPPDIHYTPHCYLPPLIFPYYYTLSAFARSRARYVTFKSGLFEHESVVQRSVQTT